MKPRIWAGYLNQQLSRKDRAKLKVKAQEMDKRMVKVTVNKETGKKVVTGTQHLNEHVMLTFNDFLLKLVAVVVAL